MSQDSFFYKKRLSYGSLFLISKNANYLFITYIVTSKPKRISVAVGVVHIIILLKVCLISYYKIYDLNNTELLQ